jgi:hypothetical protein
MRVRLKHAICAMHTKPRRVTLYTHTCQPVTHNTLHYNAHTHTHTHTHAHLER